MYIGDNFSQEKKRLKKGPIFQSSQRLPIWPFQPSLRIFVSIPHGLMARIPGSHPGGPGSIPGVGNIFIPFFNNPELKTIII